MEKATKKRKTRQLTFSREQLTNFIIVSRETIELFRDNFFYFLSDTHKILLIIRELYLSLEFFYFLT